MTTLRLTAGTDIVSVRRITALVEARGDRFLQRWFTPQEISYCLSRARPGQHLAARFAAKEAVVKALPIAWSGPLPWRAIEVGHGVGGRPTVALSGEFGRVAADSGVVTLEVSLSHCDEYAVATVVAQSRRENA